MAKTETIIVRVDPDLKRRIEDAAQLQGKSLTTFLLEAAEKAVRKADVMPATLQKPSGRGACPTWFVARCHEARQGGAGGYQTAGRELARKLAELAPHDIDSDEDWQGELDQLRAALGSAAPDDESVWAWFQRHLPRCIELIPTRRRKAFLSGVYSAAEDESIELDL